MEAGMGPASCGEISFDRKKRDRRMIPVKRRVSGHRGHSGLGYLLLGLVALLALGGLAGCGGGKGFNQDAGCLIVLILVAPPPLPPPRACGSISLTRTGRLSPCSAASGATTLAPQLGESFLRFYAAGQGPIDEFHHVHAPLANLRLVNPDVVRANLLRQLALSQPHLLAHPPEHRGERAVAGGVLGLGHGPILSGNFLLLPIG
jgi:hypothetical protein